MDDFLINIHLDTNECANSPCDNGGTCLNDVGSFRCKCPPNWEGRYCRKGGFVYCKNLVQHAT